MTYLAPGEEADRLGVLGDDRIEGRKDVGDGRVVLHEVVEAAAEDHPVVVEVFEDRGVEPR